MAGYREICAELATRISAGELRPGDELPGVRELARQWSTAASTVSHAQRELADAGLIELADRRRARVAPDAALAARRFLHAESVFTLAGSDDPALDLLARRLPESLRVVTGAGSFAGLGIVRNGRADGAAIHLLHHTGVYNVPFAQGLLRAVLFQTRTTDALAIAVTTTVLLLAAGVACLAPARRAARVAPVEGLRGE